MCFVLNLTKSPASLCGLADLKAFFGLLDIRTGTAPERVGFVGLRPSRHLAISIQMQGSGADRLLFHRPVYIVF